MAYHATFMEAHAEFRDEFRNSDGAWGAPPCGESGYAGISFTRAEMNTPEGFERFVAWRLADALDDAPRPVVQVPTTYLWIIDDDSDAFLGSVHIRHRLTNFLQDMGGHISYSVRPSARGRGVASEALRLALAYAGAVLSLPRVLITTTTLNEASARVIEHNGGVLEDMSRGMRRYWVQTPQPQVAPARALTEPPRIEDDEAGSPLFAALLRRTGMHQGASL